MNILYPFQIDGRGLSAQADANRHIRDMIEQLLFTNPGERVNRPTFGSGLQALLFGPISDAVVAATQMTVQAGLQQWLGDVIRVEDLEVTADDATLLVVLTYSIIPTGQRQTEEFQRGVPQQ
jgi:phage baseplate assembly protein W